jgi:hypothetical protein
MRVFSVHEEVESSQDHIFSEISRWRLSSPSRASTVAIHCPSEAVAHLVTQAGSIGVSSRFETRLEGATSSSRSTFDVKGTNACSDDGCEEGRMILEDAV